MAFACIKHIKTLLVVAAVVGLAPEAARAAITVTSGDIYALDPTATDYGAVRFKDFINAGDGGRGQNLYLQDKSSYLGGPTGSDGRARVNGDPFWTVGTSNSFWFEYRPVTGATDLILSGATDRYSPGFSRVIDDPMNTVNYISFYIYIQSNEGATPTDDGITLNLTDLDGNALSPSSLSFGYPPGGSAKWYLTDPTLLANGFILTGNILLSGTLERTESDKVQIAFGNTAAGSVPEPSTVIIWSLLGLTVGGASWWRRRKTAT